MFIYIFTEILLVCLAVVYPRLNERSRRVSVVVVTVFLALMAGLRGSHVDVDYWIMKDKYIPQVPPFSFMVSDFAGYLKRLPDPELSFSMLVSTLGLVVKGNPMWAVAAIYAFLAVPLKVKALKTLTQGTQLLGLVLLVYFGQLFLLQEMTQFRAGLGTAIVLIALPFAQQRKPVQFFLLIVLAAFVHRSMATVAMVYFFNPRGISPVWLVGMGVIMVLSITSFDPVSLLLQFDLPIFHDKLRNYVVMQKYMDFKINYFNVLMLFQIVLILFLYWKQKAVAPHSPCFYLLLKMSVVSVFMFYFFAKVPVFAYRLSDLFGAAQVVLVPLLCYAVKPKWVAQLAVVCIAFGFFFVNEFHNKLLDDYSLIFMEW